jgi:histone H3/H4
VAVAKATEIFLAQVVDQSHQVCKKKKRKTIKVNNVREDCAALCCVQ